jgi:hypothetical protein
MPEPVTIPTIHREDVRYLCERDYQRPAVNVILDMCGFRREMVVSGSAMRRPLRVALSPSMSSGKGTMILEFAYQGRYEDGKPVFEMI